jgi:hypothetical protein
MKCTNSKGWNPDTWALESLWDNGELPSPSSTLLWNSSLPVPTNISFFMSDITLETIWQGLQEMLPGFTQQLIINYFDRNYTFNKTVNGPDIIPRAPKEDWYFKYPETTDVNLSICHKKEDCPG